MSEEYKDLLPCPFCGSDSADLGTSQDDGITKWSVLCSKCGASCSLYCDSESHAVELWNMRTPAAREAHAEIQRLQNAKRRALALADERAKENVALRAALAAPASEGVRESDEEHYLKCIKLRLETLYELTEAPNLREQISDEIDWVNEKLGDPADTVEPDQGEDYLGERP